ncbi:hypothetical protein ATANTOWER_019330 [Ataeniobius toweri]|uniref:Uncharacterized protein n=1 Tax=Ataeniobius toweri TaxID=208326 RepID=A0ABU7CAC4_9TELE|nr:hypothetical protein [Ataeniobius toweri]
MNDPATDVFPSVIFCSCFSGLLQFVQLCRHCLQQQVCHVSLRPDEIIYPPCSFAQGSSDCVFTHSKPLRFSLRFSLTNLGLHNPRFYENRHSPLRSGVYWFLKAEEKTSSLGSTCPVSSFILRPG